MALVYARKVNQQCLYVEQVLQLIEQQGEQGVTASLLQAGYLQLELGLRLYVLELAGSDGAEQQIEFLSLDALRLASKQAPSTELGELVDLLQRPESWLARFVEQLRSMRSGEPQGKLKGEVFQADEQESNVSQGDRIALREVGEPPQQVSVHSLQQNLQDFKKLVERQRAVRAEY